MHYSTYDQQYKQDKMYVPRSAAEIGVIASRSLSSFTNISRRASSTVIALAVLLYISVVKRSVIGNAKSTDYFDGNYQG